MLFPDFIVGKVQHRLQKRATLENCRHVDETMAISAKRFETNIRTVVGLGLKQGRRDFMRLKAHIVNMRSERKEKMKELGKTDEEIKKVDIKEAFDSFDTDSGGSIDAGEFRELMWAMGTKLSANEIKIALHRIDKDGSGEIEFTEFEEWWDKREADDERRRSEMGKLFKKVKRKATEDGLAVAAAERTAQRFLVNRATIRAHIDAIRTFRSTRPPRYGWCKKEWLEAHGLSHLTLEHDEEKNQELRRQLRVVESKCEVPKGTKPYGMSTLFHGKDDSEESSGLQRAQNLAEEECRRWLRSGSGRRALTKQSYVLNSLHIEGKAKAEEGEVGKKRRKLRKVFNIYDSLSNGDVDVEDAWRVVRRKGLWLNASQKTELEKFFEERDLTDGGFAVADMEKWFEGREFDKRQKLVGSVLKLSDRFNRVR